MRKSTGEKNLLILRNLENGEERTINEIIDLVKKSDDKKGIEREDCKFYNHINKQPAPLRRRGLIEKAGKRKWPSAG